MKFLEFDCETNLSQYTDSMLFDSGTEIAFGKIEHEGKTLDIFLRIVGEVLVDYRNEIYYHSSEFPEALKEEIKKNPYWDTKEDTYVGFNNWFEYLYGTNGSVLEGDLSKYTVDGVKNDMLSIAKDYFNIKEVD